MQSGYLSRQRPPFVSLIILLTILVMASLPDSGHSFKPISKTNAEVGSRGVFESSPTQQGSSSNGLSLFYALVVAGSDIPNADDGNVYRLVNGNLSLIGRPTTQALRDVGWRPGGAYALIVGFGATVLKYDGNGFTSLNAGVSPTKNFHAVAWRPDGAMALIIGSSGTVVKYDGASFTTISTPVTTTLRSVSWRSNSYATLVGAAGTMLIYENDQIQTLISGTTSQLHTVAWNPNSQYALVGGASGTILRHDGSVNTPINTTGIYDPSHVILSIGWNDTSLALISGQTGLVLTYNGTSLTRQTLDGSPNATNNNLNSLDWFQGNATIVGGQGTILEFSGTLKKFINTTIAPLRHIGWRPYIPLTANFSFTPSPPSVGNLAIFSGSASGGLPPYTFVWNFADGTTGTGSSVSHTYNTAGNYSIVLTVTDAETVTTTGSQVVTVAPWSPDLFKLDWADYDNNGQVDILDIAVIAFCYGQTTNSSGWPGCVYWDLDLDGRVIIIDLAYVAFYFGATLLSPFPGQGEPAGNIDGQWEGYCSILIPFDQAYCMSTFG